MAMASVTYYQTQCQATQCHIPGEGVLQSIWFNLALVPLTHVVVDVPLWMARPYCWHHKTGECHSPACPANPLCCGA